MNRRRVVVTGVGLVSPLAVGTEATWRALLAGESGVGPITRFDTSEYPSRIAGEVPDFDAGDYFDRKDLKKTDLHIQYAVAAAGLALEDSGMEIDDQNAERVGVTIGSGMGGLTTIEATHEKVLARGPSRISPFFIPRLAVNLAAGHVSIRFGAQGPNTAPCTACTTGLHAVGDAFRMIQHGYADAMIAGGTEGVVTPLGIGGFCAMKALSTRNDEPERASRPWDRDRDGFVLGEGSGVMILEELDQARGRGAHIYAEVVGYGMSGDAHHISAPHPEGRGAETVMRKAVEDAELPLDSVDYINAHGTSTPLGDLAEVRAVRALFGAHADELAVSSTKSSTGHLLGAAGGLETGFVCLAIRDQVLPATINHDNPGEECDLDFVPLEPRASRIDVAINNSFGFGGTNGALVLKKFA